MLKQIIEHQNKVHKCGTEGTQNGFFRERDPIRRRGKRRGRAEVEVERE